jgi:MinD-like ATPase involved in chromosome partitioning or flagellar assembly
MTIKISIVSFRGGTGKTNITANLGALFARGGLRVGIMDTDILSPGLHVLFELDEDTQKFTLNDYIWGRCDIAETAPDVTAKLGDSAKGKLFLVPSSIKTAEIARLLRDENYNPAKITEAFDEISQALELDLLLLDTHPGINDETAFSMALSDVVGLLLRPDFQDYQGTSVALEIAEKFEVPRVELIVNRTPALFSLEVVKSKVEEAYQTNVAAVLPHSDTLMALASRSIYVQQYPDDPLTEQFKQIARKLVS